MSRTARVFIPISDFFAPGETFTLDDNGTADASDDVVIQFVNVDGKPPKKDSESKRRFSESEQRNSSSMGAHRE